MAQEFVQFVHTETYGEASCRRDRPGRPRKLTAGEALAEALREKGACHHVKKPMAPKVLFSASEPLSRLLPLIVDLKAQGSKASGRLVRKDAQCLLAGVASYPAPMSELRQRTVEAARERERHDRWVELNLAWLKTRYAGRLHTVIEHLDERYPHIHWYCPGFLENGRFTMGDLHAGQHAAKAAVAAAISANGGPLPPATRKKVYNDAYKAAERALQDDYHQRVGKPLGMARVSSAPRPRVPRPVHLANERAKAAEAEADKARSEAEELRRELDRVNRILFARRAQEIELEHRPERGLQL